MMTVPTDQKLPGVRDGKFDLGGNDFGVLSYACFRAIRS
jgi:hypothetical protein